MTTIPKPVLDEAQRVYDRTLSDQIASGYSEPIAKTCAVEAALDVIEAVSR